MINEKVTSGKAAYEFLWNSWSYENSSERRIAQRKKVNHPDWFYHSSSICYGKDFYKEELINYEANFLY